eukprot:1157205-Pelagomonas_calceolata.AAC.5
MADADSQAFMLLNKDTSMEAMCKMSKGYSQGWPVPYAYAKAQKASRRVPVKKEQSTFKVQARCRFWLRIYLYFIDITPKMSDACRKVARGQSKFPAIFWAPRCSLTSS